MHLAIDVREACNAERTGKGQWTYGFVSELLKRNLTLTLCTNAPLPDEWSSAVSEKGVRVLSPQKHGFRWHIAVARLLQRSTGVDAYVSPTSYIVPSIASMRVPSIPIVHDLIAFRGEHHDPRATFIERLTLKRACRNALHVCTVSETTRDDLLLRYPVLTSKSVTAIYSGPTRVAPHNATPDGRTILCVGTLCPRKNQLRLIRAYASLDAATRKKWRLVLAGGRGWFDDEIVALAAATAGVEWMDYVRGDALSILFQNATIFALPSLYEGFGLPVLDAMQHGVPVLTSNRGSLAEVAKDASMVVDPESVSAIAEGLHQLINDEHLREKLREKGREKAKDYSWKRTVDLFLSVPALVR